MGENVALKQCKYYCLTKFKLQNQSAEEFSWTVDPESHFSAMETPRQRNAAVITVIALSLRTDLATAAKESKMRLMRVSVGVFFIQITGRRDEQNLSSAASPGRVLIP